MTAIDQYDAAARLHEAWQCFCERLLRAGDMMLRDATPRDELTQAEGYRFLCRLLRAGLEDGLEAVRDPVVRLRDKDPYLSVGFTSPDQDPLMCTIDPSNEYRIIGHRGTNAGLGIMSMNPATMQHVGWLNHLDLEVSPDGSFEIIASRAEHSGNWLKLSDRSSRIVVRCNYNDRAREERATFRIEEIDAPPLVRKPASAESIVWALNWAISTTQVKSGRMVEWAEEMVLQPNRIELLESYSRTSGSPDHNFRFGYFELQPGQALELRFAPPPCDNWQFQVGNWWVENLDNYEDNQGWINKQRATPNADGSITIIAGPDPIEMPNWVDTFGRRTGIIGLRFVRATQFPEFSIRLVSARNVVVPACSAA